MNVDLSHFRNFDHTIDNIDAFISEISVYIVRVINGYIPPPEKEMRLINAFVQEGNRCIDVGAHYGYYTVPFSSKVGPTGSVISFEPYPTNYEVLTRIIENLKLTNVTTINAALSDYESTAEMEIPPIGHRWRDEHGLPYGLARFSSDETWVGRETVEVEKYDDLEIAEIPIHFVKIDVEGVEYDVVKGMYESLRRFQPIVQVEIEERHLTDSERPANAILGLLGEIGYGAYTYFDGLLERGVERVEEISKDENNYIFITPKRAEELGL